MNIGELEKLILEYFWQYSNADVKQVHSYFSSIRGGSLNTYQTTLDRLYKKGLLSRTKIGHAFIYRSKVERSGLIAQLIKSVTSDFVSKDETSLIAAFSSMSEQLNEEQLVRLEALIEQRKKQLRQ